MKTVYMYIMCTCVYDIVSFGWFIYDGDTRWGLICTTVYAGTI